MDLDNSHDTQFVALPDLNWLPWIGENYQNKKVILIGESHYDDLDGWLIYKDATRHFVQNQGLNSQNPDFRNRRLFQGIEKVLLNKDKSSFEERNKLWKNVGFYNLVQRLLPSRKDRPTDDDYDPAWSNFLNLLDIIKPKICIKFGYEGIGRLGYLLNNSDTEWARDNIKEFYDKPFCINLTKNDYKVRIIYTHHPLSRGFDYKKWAIHVRNHFPDVDSLFD